LAKEIKRVPIKFNNLEIREDAGGEAVKSEGGRGEAPAEEDEDDDKEAMEEERVERGKTLKRAK
jgi:hypothetical protein